MPESIYTNDLQAILLENLRLTMTANSEKPRLLLFLSSASCEDACVANSVFKDEAQKMDLIWTSNSKLLAGSLDENSVCSQATLEDLKTSDLVILLDNSSSNASSALKSKFPAWAGKTETWDLSSANVQNIVAHNVGKLLVRLILQGGKRQSSSPQSVSSNPNLYTSGGGTEGGSKDANNAGAKNSGSKDSVRVSRESKGRGGKTVTIVSGLTLDDAKLQELSKRLKQVCGTGGTVKDGKIEIQGDQCERVLAELQNKGYKAKRSGG
jgi:translation initiation factor 1